MRSNIIFSILILCVVSVLGCNSTPTRKPDFSKFLPAGPPAKVIAVWEPAVKHTTDEDKAQRGFGGRVYFYDQAGKRPIRVDGNVIVYAFDEDGRRPDDNVPSRSYLFDEKDIKKLYSKSKLGHSYNFWVPWDADGSDGKVKKVSLIVRFVPAVGSSVVSSQAMVYLPGKIGDSQLVAKASWDSLEQKDGVLQQASCLTEMGDRAKIVANHWNTKLDERTIESSERPTTMATTTINVQGAMPTSPVMQAQQPASVIPAVPNPTFAYPVQPIQQAGLVESVKETPKKKDFTNRSTRLPSTRQ